MISVVIPAYNAGAFLAECLDSVLSQDYADWEAIVVDDGSTDSTPSIAASYAARDSRIRVVSKPNGGLSDARNCGTALATGEWIVFLDSDDCLYPWSMTSLLAGSEGADVVIGRHFSGTDYLLPTRREPGPPLRMSGIEALVRMLYQDTLDSSAWSKMYRRSAVADVPFRKGIWYEDIDFSYRFYSRIDKVAVISAPVYFYRANPSSFINTFSPGRLDVLKVTQWIEEDAGRSHPELLPAARDRRLSACFNMYALLDIHDREGRYADVKSSCWTRIRERRRASLLDPRVRLKNKLGILLSCLGPRVYAFVARRVYR